MYERAAWVEVNLGHIAHNLRSIKLHIGDSCKLCLAIKADAYGHGAVAVSNLAAGCGVEYLAVATLTEALELRRSGNTLPILILSKIPAYYASYLAAYNLEQTVFDRETAGVLSEWGVKLEKKIRVHVKIDSGMGRIGVNYRQGGEFVRYLLGLPGLTVSGIFTHFADADSRDLSFTYRQLRRFCGVLTELRRDGIVLPLVHAANSAATLAVPDSWFDMVRVGIAAYGLRPSPDFVPPLELRPAMELKCRIVQLKEVPAGTPISYGCTFVTSRPSRIATLPVGYADGYSRRLSNRGWVMAGGVRVPVVGRVCMDQTMIDVTDVPAVGVDDEVSLFGGDGVSVDEVAGWLGTVNYEVITSLSQRVPVIYRQQKDT
ncbi:MAG: alanine racemase [Negativicutes bacterium]|nr:alanine racemase [Negativicutes bacterium]